jgi:hypothetical protein
MRYGALSTAVLLCAVPPPDRAMAADAARREGIVIRDDRPDSLYLALGERSPAVGRIGRRGDGTLVSPTWVLTAAHVAAGLERADVPVVFGDRGYQVRRVVLHPDWVELGPHDIALVELAEPVTGIAPIPFYAGRGEVGRIATLVGHGDTRSAVGGPWVRDGRRRGATSRVEGVDGPRLVFRFDRPPAGTELEGAPGRGDSGGPALLDVDGSVAVAGVSSAGFDGEAGPGTYGAVDHYTRVSDHLDWLRRTMASASMPR